MLRGANRAGGGETGAAEERKDVVGGAGVGLRGVGGELDEVGGPGDVGAGEGLEGWGVGGAPDGAGVALEAEEEDARGRRCC